MISEIPPRAPPPDPRFKPGPVFVASGGVTRPLLCCFNPRLDFASRVRTSLKRRAQPLLLLSRSNSPLRGGRYKKKVICLGDFHLQTHTHTTQAIITAPDFRWSPPWRSYCPDGSRSLALRRREHFPKSPLAEVRCLDRSVPEMMAAARRSAAPGTAASCTRRKEAKR